MSDKLRVYYCEIDGYKCYTKNPEDAIITASEAFEPIMESLVAQMQALDAEQSFTAEFDPESEPVIFGVVLMTQEEYDNLPDFVGF